MSYILMQYCQPHHIFLFKAVSQTALCNNYISILPIRLFLHWYLFCLIIEFDVWRRAIFSLIAS